MISIVLVAALTTALPHRAPATDSQSTAPAALTDEEVRHRVAAYLNAIDTPIRAQQWKDLGPRATVELEARVQDKDALPSVRARAVEGLAAVPGPKSEQLMLAVAKDELAPATVRRSALRSVSVVIPATKLATTLKPVLEGAKERTVRQVAAQVLAAHGHKDGCTLVRKQLAREDSEFKDGVREALGACR